MLIEVGIIRSGVPIVISKYRGLKEESDDIMKCALLEAIQILNKECFSQNIDILEGSEYIIVFHTKDISSNKSPKNKDEWVLGYAIIENGKKEIENYIKLKIKKKLIETLINFKKKYADCDFTSIYKFKSFKDEIDLCFKELLSEEVKQCY